MKRAFALVLALSSAFFLPKAPPADAGKPQREKNRDPDAAELIVSDIDLFWKAYDGAKPENLVERLREEYLKKGSVGLKEFMRVRIGSAENLAKTIEQHPKYYATLRDPSLKVAAHKKAIRACLHKLKKLYEPAVFPNVYFVIGRMNSGGTLTDKGLLIGVEMYGLTKGTPMKEMDGWHKAVLKPVEEIPYIVAHELIHYQQKFPISGVSLLGTAIAEGGADFVGELISGSMINAHLHKYGNPRERELWAEFKKQMDGKDVSNWLFQGDRAKDRPADLGYYVGYKICESFYKQAADKNEAIKAILEIRDFKDFLRSSKYEQRMEKTSGVRDPSPARVTMLPAFFRFPLPEFMIFPKS
ncbi:MAG: hypothetical protein HY040_20085 [Planctomycetes bacterium]|nr:hypothetical protein [Planctomycetota bacterium]